MFAQQQYSKQYSAQHSTTSRCFSSMSSPLCLCQSLPACLSLRSASPSTSSGCLYYCCLFQGPIVLTHCLSQSSMQSLLPSCHAAKHHQTSSNTATRYSSQTLPDTTNISRPITHLDRHGHHKQHKRSDAQHNGCNHSLAA